MTQRTLPNPNQAIGTGRCVHCGSAYEVKITTVWNQELLKLLKGVNRNAASNMKSGTSQANAGAADDEFWLDTSTTPGTVRVGNL